MTPLSSGQKTDSADPWQRFRDQMPIAKRFAYLDHAAVAPLPWPAREAIAEYADQASKLGDTAWTQWERRVSEVRNSAASLIAADPDEIAFVANTSTGIGLVAEGYPWRPGDNVVVADNEFPSNLYPWLHLADRGVEVRRVIPQGVALGIDQLRSACNDRTRVIAVSWVGYATGWRLDLDDLVTMAHARDCHVFLDAIQGLGVFPLDVRQTPVDFFAADGHKWLLGPEGAGILYLRREHLHRLRPLGVGWNSVLHPHDFSTIELKFRAAASRYEGGSQNMAGVHGLGASIDLLVNVGLSARGTGFGERVLMLGDIACERLRSVRARIVSDRGKPHGSGIISFELPGQDPQVVRRRCLENDVVLSCRAGLLRISPHAYNNEDDINRLIDAIGRSNDGQ